MEAYEEGLVLYTCWPCSQKNEWHRLMQQWIKAIEAGDRVAQKALYQDVQQLYYSTRTFHSRWRSLLSSLPSLFVVLAAILFVREAIVATYHVPTGSMRPTIREGDWILASQCDYGINIPFYRGHFVFNPSLIPRGSIVTFAVDQSITPHPYESYFGFFKMGKHFVKRCVALPEDRIYFYGGALYGIDAADHLFVLDSEEHIPYIRLEGRMHVQRNVTTISQMGVPLVRATSSPEAHITLERWDGNRWVPCHDKRNHLSPYDPHQHAVWGTYGVAQARLDLSGTTPGSEGKEGPILGHLQLFSLPPLWDRASWIIGNGHPEVLLQQSSIPLEQQHVEKIMRYLSTVRFVVRDGYASPYGQKVAEWSRIPFHGVGDGTYELLDGVGYSLDLWNRATQLPSTHPLMQVNPQNVQRLFNLGVDFRSAVMRPSDPVLPSRYVYFREGHLCLFNQVIFSKDDPLLKQYVKDQQRTLQGIVDAGKPSKADILSFGFSVPQGHVLMLGDQYAISEDSRAFGCVPIEYLKGHALWKIWPLSRVGLLAQPPITLLSSPHTIIVGVIASIISLIYLRRWKRWKKAKQHLATLKPPLLPPVDEQEHESERTLDC